MLTSVDFKVEPYRSAKQITGCETKAYELVNLIGQVKEMGIIDKEIKIV